MAGEARRLQGAGDARPVAVLDRHGRPRWHPVWDGNPELFEINSDGLGLPDAEVFAGQAVTAQGPLSFSFGDYQVLPAMFVVPAFLNKEE